jgi:hypothetical protein
MRAGFAELDITPPLGTEKVGWMKTIIPTRVMDPICGRAAIFESGKERIAFIQLDTLSIRASMTRDIRVACAARHGFPGTNIMISCTHNHSAQGVSRVGQTESHFQSGESFLEKIVELFGKALANRQTAEIGFGRALNWSLAKNRRVVMRSGEVRTQETFNNPDALYIEGPVDPEVVVLAARDTQGNLLGLLANYACHPTHFGGDEVFTAGWPGRFAAEMKARGCPVPLFINGALGNTIHGDPSNGGYSPSMEECGKMLADSVSDALNTITFRKTVKLGSATKHIQLPYRKITKDEIRGTAFGAQRFIDPKIYDNSMKALTAEIKKCGTHPAEVQAFFIDDHAFVSIPAEYFVEFGLRIKAETYPTRTAVVGLANGMVGYVPTRDAFTRGGYETTFGFGSKMGHEAGDILANAAVKLIRRYGKIST